MLPDLSQLKMKPGSLKKLALVLLAIVFVLVLVQLIAAPYKVNKRWQGVNSENYDYEHPQDSLVRHLAYLRALDIGSTQDSIYLIISLPDSSVSIAINGVKFYSTHIGEYDIDNFLTSISTSTVYNQFQRPLHSKEVAATIIKEPIKVKIAPKNAEEAAKMVTLPDSAIFENAIIHYATENGMLLTLESSNTEGWFIQSWNYLIDRLTSITATTYRIMVGILHLEIYEYQPELTITIDNVALTSIYRALPKEPYIVVYY
ncbi:hypothetical protein [Fulvivirga lutea]|uniref:Uncharacterized protein n=1 Tax=Fulvivirga lutea TaxID=2810512 RepID=A0A974WG30_9BACT|nr:hypothetical protein [Fulvivirga lutea]QSE96487.1 hypothetical protein JR347_12860 [Fulvivirga lutea]